MLLALGGCARDLPPRPDLAEAYTLRVFDEHHMEVSGRLELGVESTFTPELLKYGVADLFRRKSPCRVAVGWDGERFVIELLPHVEDDSVHLVGKLDGRMITGEVRHATDAGVNQVGTFAAVPFP